MYRIITISLLLGLTTTACQVEDELTDELSQHSEPSAEAPDDLPPNLEAVEDEPTFSLALEGGAVLSFFVAADGSVAMLEEIPLDSGVGSVLDHPLLRDASPAVVYHAITNDGSEIPDDLYLHHAELAAAGELAPLPEALAGLERGWATTAVSDDPHPCLNAEFDENHCDHPDYAEDMCLFNAGGENTWQVPGADRYKAGFCLQEGSALSWLYYVEQAGDCNYFQAAIFAWGFDSAIHGVKYNATTYRNYVWWRSSGGLRRGFTHKAIGDAGAVYDFGNRYTWGYGCP